MQLFGIDPLAGWGHITAGGTIANIEALWMARNLKVLPLGLRQVVRELGLVGHAFTVNGHRQVLGAASNQDLLRRYGPLRALDLRDAVLRELEELFYRYVQLVEEEGVREELILKLVDRKVWE